MGRGSSKAGGGGATARVNPRKLESLLSASGKAREIGETMNAVKRIADRYGVKLTDIQLATLNRNANAMAYYDSNGNLAVNKSFFDSDKMNGAYDDGTKMKWHPSRGNRSGLEATAAHEVGHALNHAAAGGDWGKMHKMAGDIVGQAAKRLGYKDKKSFQEKISGYAATSAAEAIAEAFSDVYCNGMKSKRESRAIVSVLNQYLPKRQRTEV